ncbi:nucleotidyltransferase domain-containing protein [Paucisalibacillus globulus]|uniref:nucleotidyltransferase domain-containing protein n=1 Tax=Paucisalibacillus globulus TaxID=351095 RepID=UPI0003FA1535|nr:nucleotidyltransferase domain-containing protein [Paucisalibacillus globulus]
MKLPTHVEMVLDEYINLLEEHLPNTLQEIYLHGSIAIGAYENYSSDIDLLVVMNRRLVEEDSEALALIHSMLAQRNKKPELDGVYLYWKDLRKINLQTKEGNGKYYFYNNGELHYGEYFNFNPVTWWTLKHNGIKVINSNTVDFQFDVSAQSLVTYVHENMNSYWINYIKQVKMNKESILKLPSEKIDEVIEWSVLGLLRQFYSIKEEKVISKLNAGSYGISHLPRKWNNIIQEAINIRSGTGVRITNSERKRLENAVQFSHYLIDHCNSLID